MIFTAIPLAGAYLVTAEPKVDARGFFARSWCREEARKHGIDVAWVQSNISFSHQRGTLRGMHYQAPDWEAKLKASKFDAWKGYGRSARGHIALQDHGDGAAFRNIRIRPLS